MSNHRTSGVGAVSGEASDAGFSATTEELRSGSIIPPRSYARLSDDDHRNGRAPRAEPLCALAENVLHLQGRRLKTVQPWRSFSTAVQVAGPLVVGRYRWFASPFATEIVIRAVVIGSPTASGADDPNLYATVNGVDTDPVRSDARHATFAGSSVLELRADIQPDDVNTVSVTLADKLALGALAIFERQLDVLDDDLVVDPDRFVRSRLVGDVGLPGLYAALHAHYQSQSPPLAAWSLTEDADTITRSSGSYVNLLDGEVTTSWSETAAGHRAAGWMVPGFRRGYGVHGLCFGWPRIYVVSTGSAATFRLRSEQGYVDVAIPGGTTDAWIDGAAGVEIPTEDHAHLLIPTVTGTDVEIGAVVVEQFPE